MPSNLSATELLKEVTNKRANRVITFLRKYENQEDFQLVSGGKKVKLVVTSGTVAALKQASEAVGPSPSQSIKDLLDELYFLPAEPGVTKGRRKAAPNSYRLKDFAKTAEFGGQGGTVGASPTKEAVHGLLARMHHLDPRYQLNSPTAKERGELMVLQDINQYILNLETPINVNVGGKVYKNIYGANKVKGTPKADIALVAFNDMTQKFQDVYFLSHKLGTDASGFQQYSGVSAQADGIGVDADSGASRTISQHKEVVAFLKKIVEVYYKDIATPKGTVGKRFYTVIEDDELIGKAVYGPKFSGQEKHADDVNMIAQGNPTLRPHGRGEHALSFSAAATSFSADISHFKKDDGYRAVLGARPGPGRSFLYLNKRYRGVRIGIFPRRMLGIEAKPI